MPFCENNEQAQKLCFVKGPHDRYHVKRGTPEYGFPKFTDRGWLAAYGDVERPKGKFINPRDLKMFMGRQRHGAKRIGSGFCYEILPRPIGHN